MKCCDGCFKDRFLAENIRLRSAESGACDFCGKQDARLIDPTELADSFELVCGIYDAGEEGRQLVDWLIEDWQIFAVDRAQAQNLLVEVLDDGERARQLYVPSADCASDRLDSWEKLRDELRTQNRFFPHTEFNEARVASLLESLKMPAADIPEVWYRARIEDETGAIPAERMGAPPARKATAGRANPTGIPYLYVGSERSTAITEVRPHPGEKLTIAEFTIDDGLELIDLRNPRQGITPFTMEDVLQVAGLRGDIDFLERLGEELTTPVLPNAAAIDYIPSQYLCEFIKKTGYDGVVYASSVSDGVNLALFDPDRAHVGATSRVSIGRVGIEFFDV